MRETLLPPPPSARLAAWARLNAIWFRVVDVLARRLGGAVRVARRGVALLGPSEAPLPRASLGVLALDRSARTTAATWTPRRRRAAAMREERPTAVEVRRPA